jgi:hypothetical protein
MAQGAEHKDQPLQNEQTKQKAKSALRFLLQSGAAQIENGKVIVNDSLLQELREEGTIVHSEDMQLGCSCIDGGC